MTIKAELDKLKAAKTDIRKSIQRKGTGLTLEDILSAYSPFIRDMNDEYTPDETNLINYVEDRVYFLQTSVKKIRPYAFREFTCLQQLYLSSDTVVTLSNLNAFYGVIPEILVPSSLVSAYKSAPVWRQISDRIKAFSEVSNNEMFPLQHIHQVQTLSWLQEHTLGQLLNEFRF